MAYGSAMIATSAIFMILSGCSVVLRIWCRKGKDIPLAADDYLIVAAWLFSALLTGTNIAGVPLGSFGKAYGDMSDGDQVNFLKVFFILQFWYIIAVALVKLSILYFYGRIFVVGEHRPKELKIMIWVVIGWLISFLFATFFQIWPLQCNWSVCAITADYAAIYLAESITDILLDIAILALPIKVVLQMNRSRNEKVGIILVFGLGIFCVVSSLVRLIYTVLFTKANVVLDFESAFDVSVVGIIMWSGIEACSSTICANLPCLRPLIGKARRAGILPSRSTRESEHSGRNSFPMSRKKTNTVGGSLLLPTEIDNVDDDETEISRTGTQGTIVMTPLPAVVQERKQFQDLSHMENGIAR